MFLRSCFVDRGDCLVMKLGVVTCSIIRISVHQCLYVRKAVVIFRPCGVFGQFTVWLIVGRRL